MLGELPLESCLALPGFEPLVVRKLLLVAPTLAAGAGANPGGAHLGQDQGAVKHKGK